MTKEAVDAACRKSFAAFAAKAFEIIEPGTYYEYNWHIECISEHLQAAFDGELPKLIINMPPRSLKTFLVGVAFPAWVLGRLSHEKFIAASYSHDLAKEMSNKCRHIIKSKWYQDIFPATVLDLAQNQKHHWETTRRGQYYATSALGSVTGIGCFVAGTPVATNLGRIDIAKLHQDKYNDILILSYDHKQDSLIYKKLVGWREKESSEIIEIQTTNGCRFRCTADHRIYVSGRGYQRADSIQEGEGIYNTDRVGLRIMQDTLYTSVMRDQKENKERVQRCILYKELFVPAPRHQERKEMRGLWGSYDEQQGACKVLLQRMQAVIQKATTKIMYQVRRGVYSQKLKKAVLFKALCRFFAFRANEGEGQFALQGWEFLQLDFPRSAARDSKKRFPAVRCLPSRLNFSDSPYRRGYPEQHAGESNNDVPLVPHNTSQVTCDTVSSIKRIGGGAVKVYDITVEDTHNFFADDVLVHNCNYLLCDDLIKPMEAQSESIRNSTNENMRATLFSRFNDPRVSRFILVMQRLHENDPTGNLLTDGGYHLLKLPAETKAPVLISLNGIDWNMKPGELLFPARLSREILDKKRLEMTEFHYCGQMLQEPVPAGGGEFKEDWPQYYLGDLKYKTMNIVILVDAAGGEEVNKKKKKTSDWTAMMVVGLAPDNNYYLLDAVRDRLNPTERIDKLFDLHREWNIKSGKPPKVGYEKYGMMTDTHYIEKKKREEGYNFVLAELGGRMIKEERIRRLIPDLQQNRWYYPRNLWYTDCENRKIDLVRELIYSEMASFPRAKFDDMLDAKSRIYDMEVRFPALKKKKRTIIEDQGWIGA